MERDHWRNALRGDEAAAIDGLEVVQFQPNEAIFRQGDVGDAAFLLESGTIRLELDDVELDSDSVLDHLSSGEVLGEMALLDSSSRSASAYANEVATARRIPASLLSDSSVDPLLVQAVLRIFGRATASKLRNTTQRLAHALVVEKPTPEVEGMVDRACEAQKAFEEFSEEQVMAILKDLTEAVSARATELATMTVRHTRLGNVPDKAFKIKTGSVGVLQICSEGVGFGPYEHHEDTDITDVADPAGVIFAMIPSTAPVPTAIFKVLSALKGRNSIILSFHRLCLKIGNLVGEIFEEVLQKHGAPPNLVQWVRARGSRKLTEMYMSHPRVSLILATGGADMVRAAYSSGTPAIGVGPGNAPAWIASDANIEHAGQAVVMSKSFDNGLICGSEHNLLVDASVRDSFIAALISAGAAVLTPEESERFLDEVIDPQTKRFNPRRLGKSAVTLAKFAGIERDYEMKIIVVPMDWVGGQHAMAQEKSGAFLSLFTVSGDQEALKMAEEMLEACGAGHTSIIHTTDENRVQSFARHMKTSRVLVNSPGCHGVAGVTTGLPPSYTLGCGTYGGNSTTDSVSWRNLINIKRIARVCQPRFAREE